MPMNPVFKQLWIDALRSGDYAQTVGGLNDANGFCCLGVACDLIVQRSPDTARWVPSHNYRNRQRFNLGTHPDNTAGNTNYIPGVLARELGISTDDQNTLAEMNDNDSSFEEIADWIEANL